MKEATEQGELGFTKAATGPGLQRRLRVEVTKNKLLIDGVTGEPLRASELLLRMLRMYRKVLQDNQCLVVRVIKHIRSNVCRSYHWILLPPASKRTFQAAVLDREFWRRKEFASHPPMCRSNPRIVALAASASLHKQHQFPPSTQPATEASSQQLNKSSLCTPFQHSSNSPQHSFQQSCTASQEGHPLPLVANLSQDHTEASGPFGQAKGKPVHGKTVVSAKFAHSPVSDMLWGTD